MSQSENLEIASKCLFEIFQQIKHKCDIDKQLNYENLTQFAVSFEWFCDQFYNWDKELFELLELDKLYNRNKSKVTVDIDIICDGLQKFPQNERNLFWKSLINSIKESEILERFTIKGSSYYENQLDICDDLLNAIQNKQFLIHLYIDLKEHTLKSLPNFKYLKELHLNVKINADTLIEICKASPYIDELSILSNEISGRLSDITLDGNCLQKLKVLTFRMKLDADAAEYRPLAKLPKIYYLHILGQHQIGSLKYLLDDLSLRKSPINLRFLYLDDAILNAAEIQAISLIDSLEELKCGFIESESIGQLSQIGGLTELRITSKHDVKKILNKVLKIFKEGKRNYISIHFHESRLDYDKKSKLLKWVTFENDVNASDYAVLGELENLRTLRITGISNQTRSLLNLFKGFLSRMPQTLEHLQLSSNDENVHKIEFNCNEISEILKLTALKSLECSFTNINNIYILGQLPHLEKLILEIPTPLKKEQSESLKKLFILLASKSMPTLEYLDLSGASIDWILTKEMIQIKSIKQLKCSFSDVESIRLLQKLDQLEELEIRSKCDFNQISESILRILSSSRTSIKMNCDSAIIIFDSSNKILTLNMEKYADVTPFSSLGSLENCNRIHVIGECKKDSFQPLLKTLSNNKNHLLKELDIEHISINYEESLLISQIKTLEILICEFSDARSFEILQISHCHFKRIKIKGLTFPCHILDFLNSSKGTTIIENNGRQIIYYKTYEKLILKNISFCEEVFNGSDYTCLGTLDNLTTLHVIGPMESNSLKDLFKGLTLSSNLEELIIIGYVSDSELLEIANIKSLKKLKFGVVDTPNIVKLAQLKEVQELTITTHPHGSLQDLFQFVSTFPNSLALQFLSIDTEGLSFEELKAIASMRSLRRLKCILNNTENLNGLPTFPYLTELCISSHGKSKLFLHPDVFTNSALHSIIIMGAPLDIEDVAVLAQHKILKKVQINIQNLETIDLLTSLKKLEELHIELIHDFNTPEVQINLPKFPENIHKLTIKNLTIGKKDFTQILQLQKLKSLDCILAIEENENLTEFDKLEELIVTLTRERSVKKLLKALTRKPSSTLKHLVIFDELLNQKDMIKLSQIRSLSYLQCGLLFDDSFQHLKELINLKTLIITSDYYIENVSNHLLDIIRVCTKLQYMDLSFCDEEIDRNLIYKILDILKCVRDPTQQDPLKLRVANFQSFLQEHINSTDQKYLMIENN